jgi:uncharacterized protein (TIGR00730 family)
MSNICVFLGASFPKSQFIYDETVRLGQQIAKRNDKLVYGGGKAGLMGVVADSVLDADGFVIGVIPRFMETRELAHRGVSEFFLVETMHERKAKMYDVSDAFFAMPGGFGTLDEMMEILTWKQLQLHHKPVVFININHYYEPLKTFITGAIKEGLVKPEYVPLVHFVDTIEEAFAIVDETYPKTIAS